MQRSEHLEPPRAGCPDRPPEMLSHDIKVCLDISHAQIDGCMYGCMYVCMSDRQTDRQSQYESSFLAAFLILELQEPVRQHVGTLLTTELRALISSRGPRPPPPPPLLQWWLSHGNFSKWTQGTLIIKTHDART